MRSSSTRQLLSAHCIHRLVHCLSDFQAHRFYHYFLFNNPTVKQRCAWVQISGLPWVWEFPWGFPWVWVWDGYGDCDESPYMYACGNSVGIFDWGEIKRKCVKYVINVIVDVWISRNKVEFWIYTMALLDFFPALSLQNTLQNTDSWPAPTQTEGSSAAQHQLFQNNVDYCLDGSGRVQLEYPLSPWTRHAWRLRDLTSAYYALPAYTSTRFNYKTVPNDLG